MDEPEPQFTSPSSHPSSGPPPMGAHPPPAASAPPPKKKRSSLLLVFITICFILSAFCGGGIAVYVFVILPEETDPEPVTPDAGVEPPDAGFDAGFDGGFDGGFDAGFDAGPPSRGPGAWWQNQ